MGGTPRGSCPPPPFENPVCAPAPNSLPLVHRPKGKGVVLVYVPLVLVFSSRNRQTLLSLHLLLLNLAVVIDTTVILLFILFYLNIFLIDYQYK